MWMSLLAWSTKITRAIVGAPKRVFDDREWIAWRIRSAIKRRKRIMRPRFIARASRGALANSWMVIGIAGMLSFGMVAEAVPQANIGLQLRPDDVEIPPQAESTVIYDVKGRRIATLFGEQNRISIPRKEMPEYLVEAVLAIEDDDFYDHHGVRLGSIVRAAIANVSGGEVKQGGSTITQQYARNAFPEVGRGRTISRKVKEIVYARELEARYEKDEILDRYLNTVYFGRGAYGVEAAARTFFGVPAKRLKLTQAALLAGVIHAPARYVGNGKAVKARRNLVLQRMADEGFIKEDTAKRAKRVKVEFRNGLNRSRAAYFVEYVRRLVRLPKKRGGFGLTDKELLTGGLRIYTTLDLRMQKAAEKAVSEVLDRKRDPEVGMVAMTTRGEVRAMVGGRKFDSLKRARGFNYAAQVAPGNGRQAGSAFKPFTLAAYLDDGESARRTFRAPSRITIDDPACQGPYGEPWEPANYGDQGFGSMSVVEATEKSVNTVYAQMVARVGPRKAVAMAKAAGITSPMQNVCSIALGTMGVTPLEVARAYATFAARGVRPDPVFVKRVVDANGDVIGRGRVQRRRTIDREVADKVNHILERVMDRGTGTPARISRPSAGKTGTTDERRDVWFAGYTPHPGLSAAVWIGYPPDKKGRIKPMTSLHGVPATGGRFSGTIWRLFMQKATRGMPVEDFAKVSLDACRCGSERDRDDDDDGDGSGGGGSTSSSDGNGNGRGRKKNR